MPKKKMDGFGWCWMVICLLLCTPTDIFVVASPEVNETQEHVVVNVYHDTDVTRKKIVTAQFECYQKIMKDNDHNKIGPVCNRTWDGWLCWDDTEAGFTSEQHCPDYFQDFDPSEKATKVCNLDGQWFRHPESNRIWSNYTQCQMYTKGKLMFAFSLYYLAIVGHGLSVVSLIISLCIFSYFKSLSCQRISLHKNMFLSFIFNSICTVIWLSVANNQQLGASYPIGCKILTVLNQYTFGSNYFWMLCEGIYLHTLIVVAVFSEKQHLMWYYLLGWGFPLIPALIHAIARSYYYNDNCWISSNTSLLYIIHGPICAALLVNLFFLLNIVRVLITKLKVTHQAESSLYMKAVRATLILVPLLGIQFVLFPYKPQGRFALEIYDYIMNILMHYQGLLVATIFCFFNGEVQGVLRRHWNQQRIQFGSNFAHADVFRSSSYVASSLTEVHRCYSIDGHTEHMNGKNNYHDIETVTPTILRSDNLFA
eukprot:XP_014007838.1 PREDICTED: calcitonin gene-related peptide type 1 receptor-like [Salmo salar]